ncbi:anthrone oxygenase family protein [Actinosynnema sp. NPDC023587]|uniref:anthrone oxygenase family protein n=1 Tax=Actinosynnema sp. NPDC023587 TaxID=3154695 RepID=UPI0033D1C336
MFTLTIIAALGCGLMAGVFLAFSAMVVPGLRRLPPAEGVAAMRAINVAVVNPVFLLVFLGTGAVSAAAVLGGTAAGWAGAALYLLGGIVFTVAYHIPRNNALERAGTVEYWARYLREWVPGNHVRAIACLGAALAFTIAAIQLAQSSQ